MAGLSFSNSQIGLAHALGHSLGAHFKIAHGRTVGLFLPHVVEYNYETSADKYEKLNSLFDSRFRGKRLQDSLRSYFRSIGQPVTIREAGIDRKAFTNSLDSLVSMAFESTGVTTNPRDAGSDEIRKLFTDAYGGV
jgi:alcohol dehydrogenase class IV